MLNELRALYKADCDLKEKEEQGIDGFVAWVQEQREIYLRFCEHYQWVASEHGMVAFIRTRQHEEKQKKYAKAHREQNKEGGKNVY